VTNEDFVNQERYMTICGRKTSGDRQNCPSEVNHLILFFLKGQNQANFLLVRLTLCAYFAKFSDNLVIVFIPFDLP
jgi:hypothetical protein